MYIRTYMNILKKFPLSNFRVSELGVVLISSDNRGSKVQPYGNVYPFMKMQNV